MTDRYTEDASDRYSQSEQAGHSDGIGAGTVIIALLFLASWYWIGQQVFGRASKFWHEHEWLAILTVMAWPAIVYGIFALFLTI